MARIQGNLYKVPTLSTKGTWKFWYNCANSFQRVFFFLFWIGRRRRCGRHHTGDHFGRTNPIIYTGAQMKAWIHLGTRLTRSGLITNEQKKQKKEYHIYRRRCQSAKRKKKRKKEHINKNPKIIYQWAAPGTIEPQNMQMLLWLKVPHEVQCQSISKVLVCQSSMCSRHSG